MRRGTTPTITLNVDADLTDYSVYVTFQRECSTVTLENDRLTVSVANGASTVTLTLTQEETLSLQPGTADVQIRAVKGNTAIATDIQKINVGRVLLDGTID